MEYLAGDGEDENDESDCNEGLHFGLVEFALKLEFFGVVRKD
jgi:hypothetical protein